MFTSFIAIISALLPWLIGAFLGMRLCRARPDIQGITAIAAGTGGFLGYLAIALALWLSNQLGISLFDKTFVLALGVLAMFTIATLRPSARQTQLFKSTQPLTATIITLLLLYAGYSVFISLNVPAYGWDALDYWSRFAAKFVAHSTTDPTPRLFYDQSPIHPHTASFILAWSSWCGAQYGGSLSLAWSVPWLGFLLSTSLLVAGWGYNQTQNVNVALVLVLFAISVPLFENHVLISGYAELLVALAMMASSVFAAIAIQERARGIMAVALAMALIPVFLKNTGPAYALAPIVASGFVWFAYPHARRAVALTFVCAMAVIFIWNQGFLFQHGDLRLAYDADNKVITFGLRQLELITPPVSEVLANEIQSRLLNSSFSISLVAICLCFIVSWKASATPITVPLAFVIAVFTALLAQQFLSQFTEYGLKYAGIDSDTGLSRFSLPAFMLAPILAATLLNLATYQSSSHMTPPDKQLSGH